MKQETKFTKKEQQELTDQQQSQPQQVLEFATPEQMLRHDARRTPIPPAIAERLRESTRQNPSQPSNWWRRWLGT